eukprot:GFKZ01013634.1.p1 GENE.GFKZ01013634.1~~GFKZ01013634.1.p1  ORF type:complete len:302 (-),score=51.94 GFKZ01013634.1:816-1721(-)
MPPGSTRSSVAGGSSRHPTPESFNFSHSRSLDLPRLDDEEDEPWSTFFLNISQLVLRNYSLAQALGLDVNTSTSSATRLATPLLTPREAKEYAAWEETRSMPRVDWRRMKTHVNANTPIQKARWKDLTLALRVLYQDENIKLENTKAWVEKNDDMMPLLIAAKKVDLTRYDITRAGKSTSMRRLVFEALACRKLMSEIGIYRGELGRETKEVNLKINKKEHDLLKDLGRLQRERIRSKDACSEIFKERAKLFDKLGNIRVDRVSNGVRHAQMMAESKMAEEMVRSRARVVDDMLSSERRRK